MKSDLLISVYILYGKGKYLNQTVFFTKFAMFQIHIQDKGFHTLNSTDVKLVSCNMYL